MSKEFSNPMQHPDWTIPHSSEWYNRLASEYGEYVYPWKSEFDEPNTEQILGHKLSSYITGNSHVLDVGCGHGDFLNKYASKAQEAIGIDIIDGFIVTANKRKTTDNLRFLTVDVSEGLPFVDDYFDVIYSKKGPWLFRERNREGSRVIKPGGIVLQLMHGGTDGGLRSLFPNLYSPVPPFDKAGSIQNLTKSLELPGSSLSNIDIQVIEEIEYLSTPEDVLNKKYFGQSKSLKERAWKESLSGIEEIFNKHATPRGLRVTNYYYLIVGRAIG